MKWTSGAACPDGIYIDRIYHLLIKNGKIYFSDGNLEMKIEVEALKNIFTPNDYNWEDVDFNIEVKVIKK
jgi:hypothetical protein